MLHVSMVALRDNYTYFGLGFGDARISIDDVVCVSLALSGTEFEVRTA